MGDECIFCKIVDGLVSAKIEYQDDEVVAIWDVKPQAPVHVLVMPKKHVNDVKEADSIILGKLQKVIGELAEKLNITNGYQVLLNAGRYQEVPHLHYHLKGGMK